MQSNGNRLRRIEDLTEEPCTTTTFCSSDLPKRRDGSMCGRLFKRLLPPFSGDTLHGEYKSRISRSSSRSGGLKAFNAFDNSAAKSSLHVERCGLAHSSDISRLVPTGCDSTKSAEIFVPTPERQEGQYCRKKIGHVAHSALSRCRHVSWKRSAI